MPQKALSLQWLSSLPKSEQEEFKKLVLNSKKVLAKLEEICYNSIKVGESTKLTDYDSPSWSHKQADLNGYVRAYREMINLLHMPDQG